MKRDRSLDSLLQMDGERFVIEGLFWVRFEVKQVPVCPEKPHGLDYSLTLHGADGKRLLGFDNAHRVKEGSGPGAKTRIAYDHRHKGQQVRLYDYHDAAELLADFWTEVDCILKDKRGPR